MKIPPLVPCLALSFALMPLVQAAENSPPPIRWNNPDRAPAPGLVHGSFASPAMGLEVGYNVFLPPDYAESDARYPVIYFLHGAGGNENSDAAAFSGLAARLMREKKIVPAICVFPNGGRSGYRDHPERGIMVETTIVQELIPLIDRAYRTQADRAARSIIGFSMGGAGAVRLALKYPELFVAAGSWGGAFGGRDNDALPADFATEALAPVAGRVGVLLVVGTEDFTHPSHPPLLRNLTEAKFPFAFELLGDVGHDPGAYYRRSGENTLRFLTAGFAETDGVGRQ